MAWVKGQSGNPSGIPKGVREAAALAREHAPWCIEKLKHMATHSKSEMVKLRAMELLLERGLGKAIQPIDTNASIIDILDATERADILRAFELAGREAPADLGGDTAGSC